MIEIDDPGRRELELGRLGGIEETVYVTVGDEMIKARPEADQDRTTEEGKASSVQLVHFPFTLAQIGRFRTHATRVTLGLDHPNYGHIAVLPATVRAELAKDFDWRLARR